MDISRKFLGWELLLFKNKKNKNLFHSFLNKQDLKVECEHTQQQNYIPIFKEMWMLSNIIGEEKHS